MTINQTRAKAVAERTKDAHSFERYGAEEWYNAALALFTLGLSERGVEAVLRSKWMRWAADYADAAKIEVGAVDLIGWINRQYPTKRARMAAVKALIADTF